MKKIIKNLLYVTSLCLMLTGFLFPAVSRALIPVPGGGSTVPGSPPGATSPASGNSTALCFDQNSGQVFRCSDTTGIIQGQPNSDITRAATGTCYIHVGGQEDANGNLEWTQQAQSNCSLGAFANGPTCPPAGAAPGYQCAVVSCNNNQPPAGADYTCQNNKPVFFDACGNDTTASGCDTIVTKYIQPVINVLAAAVGLIVVIMVIIGGIQYTTAGDNPQAVQAAKGRIINALLALLLFGVMYAFLQWLVPGGLFYG